MAEKRKLEGADESKIEKSNDFQRTILIYDYDKHKHERWSISNKYFTSVGTPLDKPIEDEWEIDDLWMGEKAKQKSDDEPPAKKIRLLQTNETLIIPESEISVISSSENTWKLRSPDDPQPGTSQDNTLS